MNDKNRARALADYNVKKNQAESLAGKILEAIKADRFQDKFGWANNGTMGHYVEILQDLHDMMYGEGEYADVD